MAKIVAELRWPFWAGRCLRQRAYVSGQLRGSVRGGGGNVHLRDRAEEFEGWHISVASPEGPVRVLWCPEGLRCAKGVWHEGNYACDRCEAPLRAECRSGMTGRRGEALVPPAALANDLM
eukprot:680552-Pyramimonas_sp.AAC.1